MPRKTTIDVAQLIEWVNTRCATDSTQTLTMHGHEVTAQQAYRLGLASLLEQALHATGNYQGFSYSDSEYVGEHRKLREGYDATRRMYYSS